VLATQVDVVGSPSGPCTMSSFYLAGANFTSGPSSARATWIAHGNNGTPFWACVETSVICCSIR
jgi:hypothetical protein